MVVESERGKIIFTDYFKKCEKDFLSKVEA